MNELRSRSETVASSSQAPFELTVRVKAADIDQRGHVNNVVYLRWVQEATCAHWEAVATAEEQATIVWVILRHEIDYKAPAFPDDVIIARTWVGRAKGLCYERHTEIVRAADQQQLAAACTCWCPLSARSGKPQRLSADLRSRFSVA